MPPVIKANIARYASLLTGVAISLQDRMKKLCEGGGKVDAVDLLENLASMMLLLSETRKEVKAIMRSVKERKQ